MRPVHFVLWLLTCALMAGGIGLLASAVKPCDCHCSPKCECQRPCLCAE